jgi:hypothetical protein
VYVTLKTSNQHDSVFYPVRIPFERHLSVTLSDALSALKTLDESGNTVQYGLLVAPEGMFYNPRRAGRDVLTRTMDGIIVCSECFAPKCRIMSYIALCMCRDMISYYYNLNSTVFLTMKKKVKVLLFVLFVAP